MLGIFVVFHLLLSKTMGFMAVLLSASLKKTLGNGFLLLGEYQKIFPTKMVYFLKNCFGRTINTIYNYLLSPDVYLSHYGMRCMVYLAGQNFGEKKKITEATKISSDQKCVGIYGGHVL